MNGDFSFRNSWEKSVYRNNTSLWFSHMQERSSHFHKGLTQFVCVRFARDTDDQFSAVIKTMIYEILRITLYSSHFLIIFIENGKRSIFTYDAHQSAMIFPFRVKKRKQVSRNSIVCFSRDAQSEFIRLDIRNIHVKMLREKYKAVCMCASSRLYMAATSKYRVLSCVKHV